MHIYLLKKDGMEKERVNKQNKAFSKIYPNIKCHLDITPYYVISRCHFFYNGRL